MLGVYVLLRICIHRWLCLFWWMSHSCWTYARDYGYAQLSLPEVCQTA